MYRANEKGTKIDNNKKRRKEEIAYVRKTKKKGLIYRVFVHTHADDSFCWVRAYN